MKRKNYLYENTYKFENIESAFDEVCRNTKNKKKVARFKEYKCVYLARVYYILKNRTRKGLGTSEGLKLEMNFHRICKIKYGTYYILKCDISKFFASINHDILKEKLRKKIKDKEALQIVFDIIDNEENGLSIGAMTSQVLAIFYLNDMDYFIKETLKIKYFVRYQDDFLLFHPSKEYLKYCFDEIQKFLEKEKLFLNKKSRIFKSTNRFIFLGYNSKGKYSKHRTVNRKLKKRLFLYKNKDINLSSITSSIICYEHLCNSRFRHSDINKLT